MIKTHDQLVEMIAADLECRGYVPHKFVTYDMGHAQGEIDVYAMNEDYVLLFEVKQTDSCRHYNKASNQMKRAEENVFQGFRVFKFYGCDSGVGTYQLKWIKHEAKR